MAIQRQTTPASLGENKAVCAKYVLYRMRQHIVARNVVRTIVGGEGGGVGQVIPGSSPWPCFYWFKGAQSALKTNKKLQC